MDNNGIFRTTALLYVKDALDKQEYESCAELIRLAKQFGASQDDIGQVIALYLKGGSTGISGKVNRINQSVRSR